MATSSRNSKSSTKAAATPFDVTAQHPKQLKQERHYAVFVVKGKKRTLYVEKRWPDTFSAVVLFSAKKHAEQLRKQLSVIKGRLSNVSYVVDTVEFAFDQNHQVSQKSDS